MTPEFNKWWDSDDLLEENPYDIGNPIYWAWEGWQAARKREWQGLTPQDWRELFAKHDIQRLPEKWVTMLLEAQDMLREKNYGTKPNQDPCGND